MIDEYQLKYRIPSLTTDAVVLRKHKNDDLHDILLVTRANYPYAGKLAFPGGFVDYGEDPEHGCLRELKEETELDGKDLELLTVRGNPNRDPRRHVVSIIYTVNVDSDSEPKGGDDAKEAKFYGLKDIIENKKDQMAFDHYGVILELIEKKFKGIYNTKLKNSRKLKSNRSIYDFNYDNIDTSIQMLLKSIEKINADEKVEGLYETSKNLKELQQIGEQIEILYEQKLDFIRKTISELNDEKWELFEEKVDKMKEIKLKKQKLEKDILKIKKDLKEKPQKVIISEKPIENIVEAKLKSENNKQIKNNNEIQEENYNKISVFEKIKKVVYKTVDDVKEVAEENIIKKSNENNKKEQIDKIKKITNDAIDEINKLTNFIVEQTNDLIEKLNEKDSLDSSEKIVFKKIKKEKEVICKNCSKNKLNHDSEVINNKPENIVHKGIKCNCCEKIIWENP